MNEKKSQIIYFLSRRGQFIYFQHFQGQNIYFQKVPAPPPPPPPLRIKWLSPKGVDHIIQKGYKCDRMLVMDRQTDGLTDRRRTR